MTEIVSTRVSDSMSRDLEEIEKEENSDRATVIRKLLAQAIAERKLERALKLYCNRKITLWKAANLAGVSLWEMMDIAKERKIPIQYDAESFQDDFEAALKEK
jgi:predicted HTH domain antitoxin